MHFSDHILSLQQSLGHYEHMLSQSHPTYLMNLRVTISRARASSDGAILILTIVSIGVLPLQILIGLCQFVSELCMVANVALHIRPFLAQYSHPYQ